jgi:hypothetical protein
MGILASSPQYHVTQPSLGNYKEQPQLGWAGIGSIAPVQAPGDCSEEEDLTGR